MKLTSFRYNKESLNIETIELNELLNLFIGRNATGKTRVINSIVNFSWLISSGTTRGHSFLMPRSLSFEFDGTWNVNFLNSQNEEIEIHIVINKGLIKQEIITRNGNYLIDRKEDKTTIYQSNVVLVIHPPKEILTLHARRDVSEYPEFEEIIEWSNSIRHFEFSHNYGVSSSDYTTDEILNKTNNNFKIETIKDLRKIGFNLDDITLKEDSFLEKKGRKLVYIKEQGILNEISENELSQGMSRAFSIIVYINYLLDQESVSTIIIDDLGEGLDYERATKLGKLLVEKLENSNIQFIATSNDSFLMDVVPIKYWNILQRDGNTVRALNYQNSKEQFDEFKLSGLSNFYLFSSDFLTQKQD